MKNCNNCTKFSQCLIIHNLRPTIVFPEEFNCNKGEWKDVQKEAEEKAVEEMTANNNQVTKKNVTIDSMLEMVDICCMKNGVVNVATNSEQYLIDVLNY